jgi:hypothetical protein
MAVANTKSTAITNADASPRVPNSSYLEAGVLRVAVGTVEVAAADDDGSVYRFCRIPSGARVQRIQILNDALTGATVYDVGLYKTAADGGAAADADVFATNVDISAGNAVPLDVTFEALDIIKIEKRAWEILNLTSDPFLEYDVCMTGDTVGSGAGTISMRVEYTL